MKIIKIVVDEIPKMFGNNKPVAEVEIILTAKNKDGQLLLTNRHRYNIPVVEENRYCEWILDYDFDTAMWDIAPDCCIGEYSMNKPMYDICPNCGKEIYYREI